MAGGAGMTYRTVSERLRALDARNAGHAPDHAPTERERGEELRRWSRWRVESDTMP